MWILSTNYKNDWHKSAVKNMWPSVFVMSVAKNSSVAGTIIIELSDSMHILQPDVEFHQSGIIMRHYDTHQCNL